VTVLLASDWSDPLLRNIIIIIIIIIILLNQTTHIKVITSSLKTVINPSRKKNIFYSVKGD